MSWDGILKIFFAGIKASSTLLSVRPSACSYIPSMASAKSLLPAAAAVSIILLALNIVSWGLYVLTALWLIRLRRAHAHGECLCAKDWRALYALIMPPAWLLVGMIVPFLPRAVLPALNIVAVASWILYVVYVLQYLRRLHITDCKCATSGSSDEMLQLLAYLRVAAFALGLVFLLTMAVVSAR